MRTLLQASLRVRILILALAPPAILLFAFLYIYQTRAHEKVIDAYVAKARAICITTESVREGMEKKWEDGLFTSEGLKKLIDAGETGKALSIVPVVAAWNASMLKAKEGNYQFKVPKFQPRNKANEPDGMESRILNKMDAEKLSEYSEIDPSSNTVRYFRAVYLSEACMLCHGDPATSVQLWGNDKGLDPLGGTMENWKVGEMHGAFEVLQSLDKADAEIKQELKYASMAVAGGLFILSLAVLFMVRIIRNTVERPIAELAGHLREGASQVSSAAKQVAESSNDMADGATKSAASLEETNAALTEMTSAIQRNAQNAENANQIAESARQEAENGQAAIIRMDTAMAEAKTAAGKSAEIVRTIDEIAFQTNLLALNAAVEAARAGDAGKSFAVVAEEVRSLARRSAEAARNTAEMIQAAREKTENGVDASVEVKALLTSIGERVRSMTEIISEVARSSEDQARDIKQVSGAVSQLDSVGQANAASSEEAAAASEELSAQAEEVNSIVDRLLEIVHGKG